MERPIAPGDVRAMGIEMGIFLESLAFRPAFAGIGEMIPHAPIPRGPAGTRPPRARANGARRSTPAPPPRTQMPSPLEERRVGKEGGRPRQSRGAPGH